MAKMKQVKDFIKGFQSGMKDFEYLHVIVNLILLTGVYLIGIGMTSIIAKISKKKFLETEISKDKESYWSDLNLKKEKTEKYLRQF